MRFWGYTLVSNQPTQDTNLLSSFSIIFHILFPMFFPLFRDLQPGTSIIKNHPSSAELSAYARGRTQAAMRGIELRVAAEAGGHQTWGGWGHLFKGGKVWWFQEEMTGWWFQPLLKNMSQLGWWNMESHKFRFPNHQPDEDWFNQTFGIWATQNGIEPTNIGISATKNED